MHKLFIILVIIAACAAGAQAQPALTGSLRGDLASVGAMQHEPAASTPLFDDPSVSGKRKSPGLAALFSLILPGAGETYAAGIDAGKYPLIAEGALWLTYGSMQYYGTWLRDDARSFAVSHAWISSADMGDQFYVDVGNFSNTFDYNEKKLRDRSNEKVYSGAAYSWQWDTDANRQAFREQRVSSERMFNNSRFVIGGMLINRIISVINAMRLTRQFNRSLESPLGSWRLESSMDGTMQGVQVSLVRQF